MSLKKISSRSLNLSFDFVIHKFQDRVLYIKINTMLRKIKFSRKYFSWFIEDLLLFIKKNGFQLRWDFNKIKLMNFKNLKLTLIQNKKLVKWCQEITNWKVEVMYENNCI